MLLGCAYFLGTQSFRVICKPPGLNVCDCLLDVTPWGQVGVPESTLGSLCMA